MKVFIIIAVFVTVLALGALLVGSYMLYKIAAKRDKKPDCSVWDRVLPPPGMAPMGKFEPHLSENRAWLISAANAENAERVSIKSHDGLTLNARIIPCVGREKPRAVILMMHGYRSNPLHDFGGSARDFAEKGFILCMPSQRAHGDSEGSHLTYGVKERYDAVRWCRFLADKYAHLPIIMCGISMGSSTVLMASSLPLPESVVGIIADCGYTTPAEICKKVMTQDMHLPAFPLYYTAQIFLRLFAGYSFNDASAVEAVSKTKLPVMLIHGTDDVFVPFEMGERIRDSIKSPCFFVAAAGAGHGESYLTDREGYEKAFCEFISACGISD